MVLIFYYFSNKYNKTHGDLIQANKKFQQLEKRYDQLKESLDLLKGGMVRANMEHKVISIVPINSASII
jgi:hypothetical protein